eukprot:30719-Pelagococcus_subviridis.AAC.3
MKARFAAEAARARARCDLIIKRRESSPVGDARIEINWFRARTDRPLAPPRPPRPVDVIEIASVGVRSSSRPFARLARLTLRRARARPCRVNRRHRASHRVASRRVDRPRARERVVADPIDRTSTEGRRLQKARK